MSGPAPAVAAVRVAVRRALVDVPQDATVLVACSGGADSLALAAGLAWEARSRQRAGAVVVDHGLQAGSSSVAAAAADACRGLGLAPVHVVRVDVGTSGGPEGAARTARYDALTEVAGQEGAVAVLLGHTLDDQAETVLLALARGSGERALAGMRPVRGLWRRPLLGVRRTTTEDACAALGLAPWHDPTNGRDARTWDTPGGGPVATGDDAPGADDVPGAPDVPGASPVVTRDSASGAREASGAMDVAALPLRSRVRREVLPVLEQVLGPGVAEALARTADALADATDALDTLAADLLTRAAPVHPADPVIGHAVGARAVTDDGVGWDVDVLAGAAAGVRRRAVHLAAVRAGCPAGSLARRHVLAVDALLTHWHGQGPVHLPGGRVAVRACGRLYLGRPSAPAGGGAHAPVQGDPGHDDLDDRE